MKNLKNVCKVFFLTAITVLNVLFTGINVDAEREVKVAWYEQSGIQYTDEIGLKQGYAYDYMQELAHYADIRYRYISGNWMQCVEMVKNGDADIMAFVARSPEQEEMIDYTTVPIAQMNTVLSALSTNTEINPENNFTYNGKNIGVIEGTVNMEEIYEFLNANSLDCNFKKYSDLTELENALICGEIDFLLNNNWRSFLDNEYEVKRFSPDYLYIAVNSEETGLLKKLDTALEELQKYAPDFNDNLSEKYSNDDKNNILFLTKSEKNYLNNIKNITVVVPTERGYLSRVEIGKYRGINIDILKELSEMLDVKFDVVSMKNYSQMPNVIKNERHFMLCGFYYDYAWAKSQDKDITQPYLSLNYYKIQNDKSNLKNDNNMKIAAIRTWRFNDDYLLKHYSENQLVWYNTVEECLNAVKNYKADATFCDTFTTDFYLNKLAYKGLSKTIIDFRHGICYAVKNNEDRELILILNKAISEIRDKKIDSITIKNTSLENGAAVKTDILSGGMSNTAAVSICVMTAVAVLVFAYILIKIAVENKKLKEDVQRNTELLNSLSRKIRISLNGIIGMIEIFKHKNVQSAENRYINRAGKSAYKLLSLVNGIFELNKINDTTFKLNYGYYDLDELKQYISNSIEEKAKEKNISVNASVCETNYKYINTDICRLKEILINLISNAFKYSENGGNIRYSVTDEKHGKDKIKFMFVIQDDGIGMNETFLKRIYEPFAQTDTSIENEGNGLGLAITKKLTEILGGKIEIKSRVQAGTRVEFSVIAEASNDKNKAVGDIPMNIDEEFMQIDMDGKRVLIVDDNDIDMEILKFRLNALGVETEEAADAEEALYMFRHSKDNYYDIMFVDMIMPKKDGIYTAKEIRRMNRADAKSVPIVGMTASILAEDEKKAMQSGMNYYLNKPFEISAVKKILINEFKNK